MQTETNETVRKGHEKLDYHLMEADNLASVLFYALHQNTFEFKEEAFIAQVCAIQRHIEQARGALESIDSAGSGVPIERHRTSAYV